MTQNYWDYLVHNLKRQLQSHSDLVQLLEMENKCLEKNEVASLPKIISQQDYLTSEIFRLKSENQDIIAKISIGDSSASLSSLISMAPISLKVELKGLQKDLQLIVNDLHKVSQLNSKLIDINLRYVSYMLKTVSEEVSLDKPVYGHTGMLRNKEKETMIEFVG